MNKRLSLISISILLMLFCTAQSPLLSSSYQKIIQLPNDSAKINRLNQFALTSLATEPGLSLLALKEAIQLSEKIVYPLGASVAHGNYASMLIYEMKLDSALLLLDKAFELVNKKEAAEFLNQQASIHNKYGALFQQQQRYDTAIKKYLQATEIYKNIRQEKLAIVGFYNIAFMYGLLNQPGKALLYAREVRRIAVQSKEPEFLLRSNIALADAFFVAKEYDSVYYYAHAGLQLTDVPNNPFVAGKFHQQLGNYHGTGKLNYRAAIKAYDSALYHFTKVNLPYEQALIFQNKGDVYLNSKNFDSAFKYANQSLEIATSLSIVDLQSQSLRVLATAAAYKGNHEEAYAYLQQFIAVKDTLDQRNKRNLVNDLEAKYQSQKKESLLLSQQNTIYQKNILNYVLIGSAVTIMVISFLSYFNYTQKQKLQLQRISELETQQQLLAAEAVLRGEEQERSRLAKDLHDGLGGMLSSIKYSFSYVKGNMIMTAENLDAFEKTMDMLDVSITEMRRVAHNMMPEALVKFGLDVALKDFCNDIHALSKLQISYQSFGLEKSNIPQSTAITVYRIIQELINNSIKHASASQVLVQLTLQLQTLSITVEDNGVGFDTALVHSAAGMGWGSIRNRVEFLKGKLDVSSQKDKGTSVYIEINIA